MNDGLLSDCSNLQMQRRNTNEGLFGYLKISVMNIANNQLRNRIPYLDELVKLSSTDKITLISVLSSSLLENEDKKRNKTMELVKRCCGSWTGEQTAEEIIKNIDDSRMSRSTPIKFE